MLLDDPGRVKSQIISVVCQIRRFDFEYNLVRGSDAKIVCEGWSTVSVIADRGWR